VHRRSLLPRPSAAELPVFLVAAGGFAVAHWTGDRRYTVISCQRSVAEKGKTGSCGVPTRSDVGLGHRVQGRRQGDLQGACPTLLTWTSGRRKCPDLMLARKPIRLRYAKQVAHIVQSTVHIVATIHTVPVLCRGRPLIG